MLDMKEKLEEAYRIANNALYFDDNSDYQTALWEILMTINPDLDTEEKLEYIETK